MKALALVLLMLAPLANAQAIVKKGDLVPDDGVWMSNQAAIATAKRLVEAESERDQLQKVAPNVPVLVAIAATALVLGVAGGFAIRAATAPK